MVQTRSSHLNRSAWLRLNGIDPAWRFAVIDAIRAQYQPVMEYEGIVILATRSTR